MIRLLIMKKNSLLEVFRTYVPQGIITLGLNSDNREFTFFMFQIIGKDH